MEREIAPIQKQEGTTASLGDRGAPVLFERTSDGKYKRPHVNDSGAVEVAISGDSVTADTELPAATLLADGDAIPTAPKVGAVMMAKNASGTLDIGKLAKAHDVDSGAGTEYATGVSLRKTASGGSVELGTSSDPIRTDPTGSTTQPVSGTVTANLGTIAGVATESTLSTLNGKVTACNTGAVVVSSSALPSGAATSANQSSTLTLIGAVTETAPTNDTASSGLNGRLQRIAQRLTSLIALVPTALAGSGGFKVDIAGSGANSTAGLVSVKIDQTTDGTTNKVSATQATASNLNAQVVGNVASGSTDSGNPVKIGGLAKTANPTAVTDGQRVNAIFDKLGKQVVVGAIRDLKAVQNTTITSSTSETTIVTAGGASVFCDLYGLVITNTSATECEVTIKDATAGTTRLAFKVPANDTRGFMLPVDSAVPQASANNNWTATCGASVASIKISALYVKNL